MRPSESLVLQAQEHAGTRFREDPTFKGAFQVGNHLLINRHHTFELGEQDIFLLGEGFKTSLFLTSAPVSIFGPRLFREHLE